MSYWILSNKYDREVKPLADRHYNRKNPDSPQFVPPGRSLVLKSIDGKAFWITSWPYAEYVKHQWAGAMVCSAFRREDGSMFKASTLIRSALSATRAHWPNLPSHGLVTFIDRSKVKPTIVRGAETWGRTFKLAGFEEVDDTKKGLMAMRIWPEDFPEAIPAIGDYEREPAP